MTTNFILDVDGVIATGQFLYSTKGKQFKVFGPHDADGLNLIKNKVNILFISGDKKGFSISKKRIKDMGYRIEFVPSEKRYDYIKRKFGFENTIYMGDGIYDARIIKACEFGIAPKNARIESRKSADYITPSKAGEGAVCDACLKIREWLRIKDKEKITFFSMMEKIFIFVIGFILIIPLMVLEAVKGRDFFDHFEP